MAEPTTAGYNPIDTQLLADATVAPVITTPTTFIAQDVRKKEVQPDLSSNPFAQAPSLFGSQFKEEPRALKGYTNESYNEAYAPLSNGEYIGRYENFIPGTNNQERLAQQQTTAEKWTNGFGKLLGKTGVAVLGGTLGVVDSLVEGISKGSLSEAYNTDFNNYLDDLNVKLDYKLPNYYTEQENNASLFGQVATTNFWADKVFGGLSFTAGLLISEGIWTAATGGVGLLAQESQLAKLAKWTVKGAGGEAKTLEALNAAKTLSKGSSTALLEAETTALGRKVSDQVLGKIGEINKTTSINAYKIRKIADVALVATRSAGYEAGMEARQYMNSTEHDWLENYQKVNGVDPTPEEYSAFKDQLTTTGNYVFGANMIIVGTSNLAQFGNALIGKTVNPNVGNNFLKRSLLGIGFDKTITEEGKILYKALEATKGQRIAGKVWGVLGAAIPEAQEEMGQRVVSQTAERYMLNAFDPEKTKTTYGVADAFTEALQDTYGTKEGLSEGLIGAIVGVLGAGVHSRFKFGNVTAEREETQRTVDYANTFTADNHINNVIANNKIQASQESKQEAIQRGDLTGELLADAESAIAHIERNQAISSVQEGFFDFQRQINAVKNDELAKELGLGTGQEAEEQAQVFKEQKIAEYKEISDKHQKNLNYAQALLGETEIAGLDKTSTREVVRAMAYSMTMGETAMRINQNLISHVKSLVAGSVNVESITEALDVQQILDLAPKEKTLKISQLDLHLQSLDRWEKEVLNRQFEASKLTDTEDNKARANALIDINKEITAIQEERTQAQTEKQLALDAIGIRNYTDANITVDMFTAQNENLDKLRATLQDIKLSDPEKFFEIQKALQAQSKAVDHIKNYQKTTQAIVNPNTRVKVINGWVSKLLNKNTKLNESTASYFTDILEKWKTDTVVVFQENQNLIERRAFENGEPVSEAYKQQLGEEVRKGIQLPSADQAIYDAYQKEIEDNAVATIEVRTEEENIRTEIDNLQNLISNLAPTINNLEDLDNLTEQQKQELKDRVKSQIDKLPEDVFFLTHLTQTTTNLEGILQTGLTTKGGIETTTNVSTNKEGLLNSISALIDGKVRHAGASNLVIMAFPKSIIPNGASKTAYVSFVEDYLVKNYPNYSGVRMPIEVNIATFSNGQLNILGETAQPNLRDQYQQRINELKKQLPNQNLTTLQQLQNKIAEIIGSNDYLTQYFGTDLAEQGKTKPSESDIKTYENLLSKIDRRVEPNTDRIISRPSNFYKNLGLTITEIDQLKVLQTRLNDWLTLEGTVSNDEQSVAEMLDLIDSLQTQAVRDTTKTELIDRDYKSVVDAIDEQANSLGSSVRGLQTPTNALATIKNQNIRFSHIRVETLASFFPGSNMIVNSNNTFEIDLNNGQRLTGRINDKGGQDIPLKEWLAVASQSNVLIKNFGTNSSAISQLLGLDSQGNEIYQNVSSDFDYRQTDGTNYSVDEEAVNAVKNGDTLDLFVSSTDAFNDSLTSKELAKQIHIYVMKNGKLLGSLPAPYDKESTEGIGIPLSELRQSAAEFTKGKKGLIKLPQKMTAKITFIGAPQITLQKSGEETVTRNNPFTKESLQNVVGQGFIENGQVTSTIKIDVNQFINKISASNKDAKIPFVAFNYNGKVVGFPVSLNSVTVDMSQSVLDIFNSTEATTAIKAKTLVDALIQNGLDPQSYGIDFTDKENWIDSQETSNALSDLSKIKQFVDVEQFATKNYNKENLINDATIAIRLDNSPFQTSKIMLSMSNKIDSDVLGYKEFLEANEAREIEIRSELNTVAKELYSAYINNSELDNNFTQTFDENPILPGDSDIIMRQNINTLKTAIKGASQKTKKEIGVDLFKKANELLSELNYSTNKSKDIKEQIKNSEYYQDADPNFITVDEEGNLENPFINETEAIQELGGIKTYEEFSEALDASDLDYLKTDSSLFEEMSEFNNIVVKEEIEEGLQDKINTDVQDTLEATLREPTNNGLQTSLSNIEGYTPEVWNSSPEAIKTLLRDIEKQAIDVNVDLTGLVDSYETKTQEEVLDVTRALDFMLNNPTPESLNHFVNTYQDFTNVVDTIEREVVKVEPKYRDLPLISLDTASSEYKSFRDNGLLKIQDNVYIKTDGNTKTLEEVEDLMSTNLDVFPENTVQGDVNNKSIVLEDLNSYVESQMADVLTNDSEFDVDTVKKLIYYKTYFGIENKEVPTVSQEKIADISALNISNSEYLTTDYIAEVRNQQLREVHPVLQNLVFNQKGITLRYTDEISVAEMNDYLKDNEDLRNYFLLSKNTNFNVDLEASEDEITAQNMRDYYANGGTLETYKNGYTKINNETIQTKTTEDFININGDVYERTADELFSKLSKTNANFYELNIEAPVLNVDLSQYPSINSVSEIETKNILTKAEQNNFDESQDC